MNEAELLFEITKTLNILSERQSEIIDLVDMLARRITKLEEKGYGE